MMENSIKSSSNKEKTYKMIVIGSTNVGKTCLVLKALKNEYNDSCRSTLGFEFYNILAKIENKTIILQTWDTCGQEAYQALISSFYKRAKLAILVYAIDNKSSFEKLNYWLDAIRENSLCNIKIVLVGNKADLTDSRVISEEEGRQFCEKNRLDLFFEASAKDGQNAEYIFSQSAKLLYDEDNGEENKAFTIISERENEGKSCSDCY